jgi:2-aminoadipate transaminase
MTDYTRFLSAMGRDLHESAIRKMGTVVANTTDLVSFAAGYPDPALFPWDELRDITNQLLSGADGTALQYGPTRGYRGLLESILGVLHARHIKATLDEVMVTSGSQQGLDLVARVLLSPGDVALVELPAYTGGISAFKNMQARLVGVRQDEDGINLEHLDEVCQRERSAGRTVKLLYLVPNFQNPTGLLLATEKRRRLLEWADRRDVLIVEDIVDTGLTLRYLLKQLEIRQPRSLRVCTLLNKQSARQVDVSLDFVGFDIPNEFVVGYGLDYEEKYRNLPYIGVLDL